MNIKMFSPFLVIMITSFSGLLCGTALAQQTEEFKPSGKVWGYAFGDFYYKTGGSNTATWGKAEFAKKTVDEYAFTFRRIYLGYDYNISRDFSSSILLESSDDVKIPAPDNRRTVFLKAMNLKWKNLIPRSEISIGLIPVPAWAAFTEKIWNYRSLEKTMLDFHGISRAVDVGIGLSGTIDSAGNFGYNMVYGNGASAKPEDLRLKVYYGELYGFFLGRKLIAEAYSEYEPAKEGKDKIVARGFLGWQTKKFTVGMEAGGQIYKEGARWLKVPASSSADTSFADIVSSGISFYAYGNLVKDKLNIIGRFDIFNNDGNSKDSAFTSKTWDATGKTYSLAYATDFGYNEEFAMLALDYTPHKNVHIMPNIWVNGYSHKAELKAQQRRSDVVARLTFFYLFK